MRNDDVAGWLDRIASLLELKGTDHFRVVAFTEAARAIRDLTDDVAERWKQGTLEEIHGVGTSIAARIGEYLSTGRSDYVTELERAVSPGAIALLQVSGLGPKRAKLLTERLGITSIADLIAAAEAHRIRTLPGMGEKSETQLLREARRHVERRQRLPLFVAWPLADSVAGMLRGHPAVEQVEPAGSIRRRLETIGDIDLLVASRDAEAVFDHAETLPLVQEVILRGPTKLSVLTHNHLQIDIRVVVPETWGAALQYFTGSKAHNIHLRNLAIAKGMKVSEYGVFRVADDLRLGGATEAEVYEILGLSVMPPEIREDRGELEAAAAGRLPDLVELADIRGDVHTHTTFSDGRDPLAVMAQAAKDLGYEWLAITDHSYGLPVTKGLTKAKALQQRREIAELNATLAPFRLLHGLELEVGPEGGLDFDDAFLATFDLVGASMHTGTGTDGERNTRRLMMALADPEVDVLNHPTGQVIGRRSPYDLDVMGVIEAAIRHGKALEINGSHRLDLPSELAFQARQRGAVFMLSSDAHSSEQLSGMRYAVALARRAWCEKADVLNTLSAGVLVRTLQARRQGGGAQAA